MKKNKKMPSIKKGSTQCPKCKTYGKLVNPLTIPIIFIIFIGFFNALIGIFIWILLPGVLIWMGIVIIMFLMATKNKTKYCMTCGTKYKIR